MSSSDKQLEQQLTETGVKLAELPAELHPSAEELLPVIDQLEICLSRVEQSPSKSMQIALYPSQKALVADPLFKHSDVDVKVSVAACISELMRITAPDAPYSDNQMKEVFELIVSTFDNLSDKSSRSFDKRTSILETVAKVRSCVVMLDLECNELIIKMFQLFLKAMRDDLPENIFSCIESIMTLVLEESEDISLELLSLILACVKKDNEEVLPVAQKLGERVLVRYGAKLKPFLLQAVNSSAISLDDYSEVVASICEKVSGAVEQNDDHVSNEQKADEHETKSLGSSADESDETTQVDQQITERVDPDTDKTSNSVTLQSDTDNLKSDNPSKSVPASSNAECDSVDTDKVVNAEQKSEQATKKETIPSPKTAGKSNRDEHQLEETPKTNTKRKRTLGKDEASNTEDFGATLVGSKVKVWWPLDRQFYDGIIDSFDPVKKRHKVLYGDGDEEILNLKRERWELIGDDSESEEERATDVGSPDSSEIPLNKKSKTRKDQSTKQGKMDTHPKTKRGGGASTSKVSAQKSGSKSKDGSKTLTKSEHGSASKTKDRTSKSGGKSVDVAPKSASKSINDAGDSTKSSKSKGSSSVTAKTSSKSKQETPKTSNAKGKTSNTVGKSAAKGSDKSKSSSSKVKESDDAKEATETKVPDKLGSEAKAGRKRRRG